jgi:hypothetical protein
VADPKCEAYAQALEDLVDGKAGARTRKALRRAAYCARRGELPQAKLHIRRYINPELLTSIELLIFGHELGAKSFQRWDNQVHGTISLDDDPFPQPPTYPWR